MVSRPELPRVSTPLDRAIEAALAKEARLNAGNKAQDSLREQGAPSGASCVVCGERTEPDNRMRRFGPPDWKGVNYHVECFLNSKGAAVTMPGAQ